MTKKQKKEAEEWTELCNSYFGESIVENEIMPGFTFSFFTGDFHLDEVKYEVMEYCYNNYSHDMAWVCWCEQKDCFEWWTTEDIIQYCKKKKGSM